MFNSLFKKNKTIKNSEVNQPLIKNKFNWKKIISFNFSEINQAFFEEIEESLILGDIGGREVIRIINLLKEKIAEEKIKSIPEAKMKLKEIFEQSLLEKPLDWPAGKLPVLVMMGINGVGKTTTIPKLSQLYLDQFPRQVWGAADTFRAAATQQLEIWANQMGINLINKGEGSDPASVAFDCVHSALAKMNKSSNQLVMSQAMAIIDTAGRLHNKNALMSELSKIIRVIDRFEQEIFRQNILVLDATLGINGFEQAKVFHEKIGIDGIILTKMDSLAKGGSIFSISNQFKLPIYFTTFGEKIKDIAAFNCQEYIESII